MSDDLEHMKQAQQSKAEMLAQWRASRIHEETLPSGLEVKLRDVTMTDLMLTGKLSEPIIDMVKQVADSGEQNFDLKMLARNAADFNQMLNLLVEISMVEPRIGEVADDDHITLAELPTDDKMFVFNIVNREVQAVRSFREGENEHVAAV